MNVFVDTSVWSLAFRQDLGVEPQVKTLKRAILGGDMILTTGLVLQELLQGFKGPKAAKKIIHDFSLLPMIIPTIEDHIEAARLRNKCRRKGVQVGTIAALIAQLCVRHKLSLLSADRDFEHLARYIPLRLFAH